MHIVAYNKWLDIKQEKSELSQRMLLMFLNQACTSHKPVCTWFLKIAFVWMSVWVYAYMCVSALNAVNN